MEPALAELAAGLQRGARLTARRLDAGAAVAAGGAILLLVALFLDWYGDESDSISAWTVFEVLDLVLAGIALLALTTFLRRSGADARLPDAPLVALGIGALLIVASQLVNHPPAVNGGELDAKVGAWLALAAAAVMLAGAVMSVARVSLSVERRQSPPPAAPPRDETQTVKLDEPPA